MKKVLILTVTAGNGHNAAANSMKDKLLNAGCEVKVVDIFKEFASHKDAWVQEKGYILAITYFRAIYNSSYEHMRRRIYTPKQNSAVQNFVKRIHGGLFQLIYDFKPDVIYSTNYCCGAVLSNLRRAYKLPSVNIACMLDYVISPFWEASVGGIDILTLSDEAFRAELLQRGFEDKNLICTGIPVAEKFDKTIDKREAREMLGLDKDIFTILIMFGGGFVSGSYSVLKALIKRIKLPVQIVVVNGKDEKSKKRIDGKLNKLPSNVKVKNFGFSKEIDLIMSACDVMIGKGGGLCTTESMCKGLPLISTNKLPMQEVYNIKFLTDRNLAMTFAGYRDLACKLETLMKNPEKLDEMRRGALALGKNGSQKIFDLIMSQPKVDYVGIEGKLDFSKINKIAKRARKSVEAGEK